MLQGPYAAVQQWLAMVWATLIPPIRIIPTSHLDLRRAMAKIAVLRHGCDELEELIGELHASMLGHSTASL